MVSSAKVILGCFAFAVFWMLAVFPAIPILPIGRTAGSLLGAVLMVTFQTITASEAYAAVDLSILGLLFGTMVVSNYLERADAFKYLGKLLSWQSRGGKDLIFRVCLVSAFSSALFTNDTTCMVLTELVIQIARENNLPCHPFLLALASSANIGSTATPIGNPQNLVIASESGISFWTFLVSVLPATLLGVVANALMLIFMYWDSMSVQKDEEEAAIVEASVDLACEDVLIVSDDIGIPMNVGVSWQKKMWKSCVYLVIVGMLVALLGGLDMSWTAITAALALIVLDFQDATPCLDKVSYSLLCFFCGMFITVEGFDLTGIPDILWNSTEPYARIDHAGGVAVLALVILILSNLISNVPTVLLLGARTAASAALVAPGLENKAWLILAWVSTVAGNLSLLGSAANLIVCEQAARNPRRAYTLTFWSHLKFGVPSTLIVTTLGLLLL